MLFHRKKHLWLPVFGQKFASCAATKVYSRLQSSSSDLGGHGSKCHPPCIGVAKIFDCGGNQKLHAIKSSEIFERGIFGGQRYRRMEDQKSWPGLALKREFSKGRGLKTKVTNENI